MKQRNQTSRRFTGFLESGTSFTGDLCFEGTVRIDGDIQGTVSTPDVLIVGPSATIRADVQAGAVQVHGHIVGDVSCAHRLELCSGGHIEGNIETPHLVIEEGGIFDGASQMTDLGNARVDEPTLGDGPVATYTDPPEPEALPTEPAVDSEPQLTGWRSFRQQLRTIAIPTSATIPPDSE